jgi:4-hydroxybenzoate polyprenyltransferase
LTFAGRPFMHAGMTKPPHMVSDALENSWVHRFLPVALWPFAQLARWERPIGWWLLMWPCWWSAALVGVRSIPVPQPPDLHHLALFMAGAILMRGAGCTYNDLVDRDFDGSVARTRSRPLPSGRVTVRAAIVFLGVQLALALVILVQFNRFTIVIGLVSLATVVIYPFMKRITWWPQLFLGLAFSWGALMGWPAKAAALSAAPLLLYAGSIAWVIGYDTIYACQDIEDDALVGVRSTARLFGSKIRLAVALFYALALALFAAAFHTAGAGLVPFAGLAAAAVHMAWQVLTLDVDDPARCLMLFKSNSWLGLILFAGLTAAAFV